MQSFYGRFRVVRRIGNVAYELALSPTARLHPVFHVSCLKPFHGNKEEVEAVLPEIVDGHPLPTPLTALEFRRCGRHHDVLVHWASLSPAEASWELVSDMQRHYPQLLLEDKQANFWVWRMDSSLHGPNNDESRHRVQKSICYSPKISDELVNVLFVRHAPLHSGSPSLSSSADFCLLDVLISITLGVSTLPVNIIIGVTVVLGLGTTFRLALELCHEWSSRRVADRVETNMNLRFAAALAAHGRDRHEEYCTSI
ncbi:hypothetical protein MLD38_021302 [Melastoma candidum]|uniref:Uncharacterized protein n=1 Tax=Melastoma candidum TaxID=119954 RepID=A0ACB9QF39_9MYRT|nr:hypothetical protein MLD38_021302 [Melastoma candidum]